MQHQATSGMRADSAPVRNWPLLVALVTVWIGFIAFTAVALADHGLVGFIDAALANKAVTQISIDLVISIVVALGFIRVDARREGLPYWPYVVATIATGSIALLAYLIHRTWRGHAPR